LLVASGARHSWWCKPEMMIVVVVVVVVMFDTLLLRVELVEFNVPLDT